ncbi:MAG TPA: hypothetical protein VD735_00290 [Candidatus Saccharimonadales bacterium]|nr:hypothetical protein [Candidatus Saccharimonadales bacterium]
MGSWYGGINYNSNTGNTDNSFIADMHYLKSMGITKVRLNIPDYTKTSQVATYRNYTVIALSMGMYVIYGVTHPNNINAGKWITASQWPAYVSAVLAEAAWAASLDTPDLEFQIGNELERQRYVKITSLTRSGTTATAQTDYPHQLQNGSTVVIRFATPSGYNGTYAIAVTGPSSFTFTVSSSLATPAATISSSYGINATDISDMGIVTAIKDLAVSVKGVFPGDTTYSVPAGSPDAYGNYGNIPDHWATAGVNAEITRLGFNLYERSDTEFDKIWGIIATAFPANKVQLTEWGLDSNNGLVAAHNDEFLYATKMRQRLALFKNHGIPAYFYNFSDPTDAFGMVLGNGGYRLAWADQLGLRPWSWPGQSTLQRDAASRIAAVTRMPITRDVYTG